MTDSSSANAHVRRACAVGTAVCIAVALGGLIAFTIVSGYPFPRAARSDAVIGSLALVVALSAAGMTLLRAAGRPWGAALSADGFTYLPFALLWVGLVWRGGNIPLLWTALAGVAAGKMALLGWVVPLVREQRVGMAITRAARPWVAAGSWLAAAGRALAPVVLVVAVARWHAVHLYDGLAAPEQGLLAHAGQAILSGDVLYRDLSSVFPPGAPYLQAGAFQVLGATLLAGNIALAVGAVLLPLVVYGVSVRLMPAVLAFAAALMAGLGGEGSMPMFLALCALSAVLARTGGRGANWLFGGMLVGLAAAFDVVVGVAMAAAMILVLSLRQRGLVMRRVAADVDLALGLGALRPFVIGLLIVWVPVAAYFSSRGALAAMAADLRAGMAGQVYAVLRPPSAMWTQWPEAGILAGGCALVLWRLIRRRVGEAEFAALTLIAFGAIVEIWSRRTADTYHLLIAAPAVVMVAALAFGRAARALAQSWVGWPAQDRLRVVRGGVGALMLIGVYAASVPWLNAAADGLLDIWVGAGAPAVASDRGRLDLPAAGGAWLPAYDALWQAKLIPYLEAHSAPEEAIFVVPGRPEIYFLAERPNAARVDYAYEGQISAGEVAQAVADLTTGKTRLVVVAPPAAPWQRGLRLDPALAAYLARHYAKVAAFGEYSVLLRRGESLKPTRVRGGLSGERARAG